MLITSVTIQCVKLQIRTHSILLTLSSYQRVPFHLTTRQSNSRFSQRQLRPFPVTAGSPAFAAVPLCREPGSRRSVQYIAVSIIFLLALFKDGDGNIFLRLTGRRHIYTDVICKSKFYELRKPARSD